MTMRSPYVLCQTFHPRFFLRLREILLVPYFSPEKPALNKMTLKAYSAVTTAEVVETVQIIAPSTLAGGYTFDTEVDGKSMTVQVVSLTSIVYTVCSLCVSFFLRL